ncbi:MAG: epoxyqueuosine reductase [Bacteroidia bacterium]|nr:epoxyqueuosine reductase [Bacteroidia bacterium]
MIKELISGHLVPRESFVFGFADLHGLLNDKFEGYEYGISIGKRLDDIIVDDIINGPTIEYYNHYKKINSELAEITGNIHADLQREGIDSLPVEPTISTGDDSYNEEYLRTLTVDISHKMVATRAGLGWIGKTALFISTEFGPRLRLVSILLRKDPGIDSFPVTESECGKCNLCVVKCPAGAANGKLWNTGIKREEFFDPHKCREKCGELAYKKLKVDARICGLCVSICPYGKKFS